MEDGSQPAAIQGVLDETDGLILGSKHVVPPILHHAIHRRRRYHILKEQRRKDCRNNALQRL